MHVVHDPLYVRATGKLTAFKTVLDQWLIVLERYRTDGEDSPQYYHERAQVGFLAASVWISGGVALEEWHLPSALKVKERRRRCDLWAYKKGQYEFDIEAKHRWWDARRSKLENLPSFIDGALEKAAEQIRSQQSEGRTKLAVLFLAPIFPSVSERKAEPSLHDWIKEFNKVADTCAGVACFFPDLINLDQRDGVPRADHKVMEERPGVAMLIRIVT